MLLGFTETEIREKMEEIISFADIGRFIDMPVKTYSSGMYSKLAFSITAVLKTDIILVDEVLSVGDAKFRKKSYQKMEQLISDKERTVIIVDVYKRQEGYRASRPGNRTSFLMNGSLFYPLSPDTAQRFW